MSACSSAFAMDTLQCVATKAHSAKSAPVCRAEQPYAGPAVSGFQKAIRGSETVLQDHICKTMNALNMRRCELVPKNTPGADWRAIVLHVRSNPDDETFNVRLLLLLSRSFPFLCLCLS